MTAPIIQAEYDQLGLLAGWFRQEADQTQTLHNNLRHTYAVLYDGGWQGRGSTAFFNEMTSEVYLALVRLYGALEAGDAVLREISAILQAAEEEAAAFFRGNSASAGAGAGAGTTAAAGAPARTAGGNPANIPTSTPEIPVGQVFSHGSMDRLIDSTFKGAQGFRPVSVSCPFEMRLGAGPRTHTWSSQVLWVDGHHVARNPRTLGRVSFQKR